MNEPSPRDVVLLTLVAAGYVVDKVVTKPAHSLVTCRRFDEFGEAVPYVFMIADQGLNPTTRETAARHANKAKAVFIVVRTENEGSETDTDGRTLALTLSEFVARLGGPVRTWLPLDPDFSQSLEVLGYNRLPTGVTGTPSDVFEEYCHVALQFVLPARVIRYGQHQRAVPLPDGLALNARQDITLLYDAKAAGHGFDPALDDVRRFEDYVRDFRRRYSNLIPDIHSFLVISSSFLEGRKQLQSRSRELQSRCGVPLCFLTSVFLGELVRHVKDRPRLRDALDWRRLFVHPNPGTKQLDTLIRRIDAERIA